MFKKGEMIMGIVTNYTKAQRRQCKASVVIDGLSGSGKSGLMLSMAYILAGKNWDLVGALDTENKSLDLYVGTTLHTGVKVGAFNIGYLTAEDGFKPSYYAAWRDAAIKAGFGAMCCDSLSHLWQYKGGVLEMVNEATLKDKYANKYTVWNKPEISSEKNHIYTMIRHSKIHCINTVRVKEKMEFITDSDGKTGLKSLGEQQIMTPDFKYEPDLVISMLSPGDDSGKAPRVMVDKSRYSPFRVGVEYNMTHEMIEQLRLFLEEGTSPEELDEMQRQEYIQATTEVLESNNSAKTIWPTLKDQAGVGNVSLKDMPLNKLRLLYTQLTV